MGPVPEIGYEHQINRNGHLDLDEQFIFDFAVYRDNITQMLLK